MQKYQLRKLAMAGAMLWLCAQLAWGQGTETNAIATHGSIRLNAADLQAVTKLMSPQQLEVLKDDARARDGLATDLLLRRVMAERARREIAGSDPAIAARMQIGIERVLSDLYLEITENAAIDEKKLEILALDEYRAFPERYRKEEVRARHLLIGKHPSCQNDAQKTLEELTARIKAGESFEDIARQYSDDPGSAAKGGDLGWVARGKTVKLFEDALFALQTPGELSPPVTTQFGVHLIQLVERKSTELRPFEEVKPAILEALRLKARQEMRNKLLEGLKDPAQLGIDAAALQSAVQAVVEARAAKPQNLK